MGPRQLSRISRQRLTSEELSSLSAELQFMDDRSAAIVAASVVEDAVQSLLVSKMRRLTNREYADLFSGDSPLTTFSAKIRLVYALKLISKANMGDLNITKDVRNIFAHARIPVDFSTNEIVSYVNALNILDTVEISSQHAKEIGSPFLTSPQAQIAVAAGSNESRGRYISSCLCLAYSFFLQRPDYED